ncbi:MAG TPA: UDP-N-acetylmuramoyl-L-alanyl-D-glutamate--2,6-diaminopimelate ligase, partial [Anaerolineales bacterium]|nr:UDP-N-acetylmuramoyl-L-alanyl-D-glutamate--2,6-diaminopimelate ligase [Anaerolineales bacterium]
MRLPHLLEEIAPRGNLPSVEITGLTADSRRVQPGALFVAVRGGTLDGHHFLADAAGRGAAALVGEAVDPGLPVPYLRVPDARLFLARAAAAWYSFPARQMVVIGVTGTDGKTTTCALIHHALERSGIAAGLVSSVGARIGARQVDTGFHVTTPDPIALQAFLAQMVQAGITHAIVETTSHGLAQHRVAGCEFDLGVLTNVTHEHLDYHGSFEAYLEAKASLFAGLAASAPKPIAVERRAVLNRDDSSFEPVRRVASVPVVAYGEDPRADVRAVDAVVSRKGLAFTLVHRGSRVPVRTPLLGAYNLGNCLAAAATLMEGLALPAPDVAAAMASFPGVPGRMELIDAGQPFLAVVDFAHTPNALRRALEAARRLTEGRVIVVFGAAGLRDREKRTMMGEIASRLADVSVLTAEDPRTEPLAAILDEMARGARAGGGRESETLFRIPDR